jgi:hypothetical protein
MSIRSQPLSSKSLPIHLWSYHSSLNSLRHWKRCRVDHKKVSLLQCKSYLPRRRRQHVSISLPKPTESYIRILRAEIIRNWIFSYCTELRSRHGIRASKSTWPWILISKFLVEFGTVGDTLYNFILWYIEHNFIPASPHYSIIWLFAISQWPPPPSPVLKRCIHYIASECGVLASGRRL